MMAEQRAKCLLGIDIGFAMTGWVLARPLGNGELSLLEGGIIVTQKAHKKLGLRVAVDDVVRCQVLARGLTAVIGQTMPAGLVIEVPHGGAQGARANRCMGMATAVAACVTQEYEMHAEWVDPGASKQAMLGARKGTKDEMVAAVQKRWPEFADWPSTKLGREAVADAAAALWAVRHGNLYRGCLR